PIKHGDSLKIKEIEIDYKDTWQKKHWKSLLTCYNSSPYFTERPTPYLCRNQLASINQGAVDPDGDSLVFRLCAPLTDAYVGVPFNPPLNFNNPFPAAFGAVFDPVTGTMTLTPTLNNWKGVFTVCVDEYRNGVLIGTISRDMQITVIDCNALAAAVGFGPQTPPLSTGMNGTGVFTDTVCVGSQIAFTVPAIDNDTDKVLISWNNGIPGATFNTSGFFLYNNVAYFSWTPTTPGTYQFLVNVTDDHCPLSASNQFVYTIFVPPILTATTTHVLECNDAIFTTNIIGGTPPYQFDWQTPNGVSSVQNPTFTFNGPGTYPVSLMITDSRNCTFEIVDTVEITPADGVYIDAGLDISFCSGLVPFQIGSPAFPN
ncbi:MAG: WbqC family protein, partial [Bacteroidia bacterium]